MFSELWDRNKCSGFAAILNRWGLDQVLAKFAILSDVVIARDPIAVCRTSGPYLSCLG